MMSSSTKSSEDQEPFELKGNLFTLTVMYLRHCNREAIDRHLAEKIRQAPGFFKNAPVVIDLETLTEADDFIDFAGLYDLLRGRGMIPVGVRNGSAKLQAAAVQAGLPVLPDNRSPVVAKKVDRPSGQRSKIVTQPVRSGQQLYAPDGDLILMGAVSPGAEVLADGSIHIYGTLRGRALAGAKGDTEARIFCQNLEAELVAIAGHYRVFEQLAPDTRGKAVQVYLLEDRLIIEPLSR